MILKYQPVTLVCFGSGPLFSQFNQDQGERALISALKGGIKTYDETFILTTIIHGCFNYGLQAVERIK